MWIWILHCCMLFWRTPLKDEGHDVEKELNMIYVYVTKPIIVLYQIKLVPFGTQECLGTYNVSFSAVFIDVCCVMSLRMCIRCIRETGASCHTKIFLRLFWKVSFCIEKKKKHTKKSQCSSLNMTYKRATCRSHIETSIK